MWYNLAPASQRFSRFTALKHKSVKAKLSTACGQLFSHYLPVDKSVDNFVLDMGLALCYNELMPIFRLVSIVPVDNSVALVDKICG